MAAFSGFGGRVQVGSTLLTATRWQVVWKTDALDVTCFEAQGGPSRAAAALDAAPFTPPAAAGQFSNQGEAGFADIATPLSNWAAGVTDMDVTVDAYYDSSVAPWSVGGVIFMPGLIAQVSLFLDRSNNSRQFGPLQVLVESVSMDVEVRGVVRYSFSGKVAGTSSAAVIPPTQ